MRPEESQETPPLPTTLAALQGQIAPLFPPSARKDLQTAVRVLARALDCPDPEHCPLDLCHRPLPEIYACVEDYLYNKVQRRKPIKAHSVRNTKNFLSRLFRFAEAQHLWSPTPAPLVQHYEYKVGNAPLRPGSSVTQPNGTYLRYAQWPPDLQNAFTAFETWATAPVVPGRPTSLRKRPPTIHKYLRHFESYFGYLHHQAHIVPTFDALFDYDLVEAYVHWHINVLHQRPTKNIHAVLNDLLALARQYRPDPVLRDQLVTLQKTIPWPSPTYNKDDAWVSLAKLGEIGRALWPQKEPHQYNQQNQTPGLFGATSASISLMLQLWTYIPYRSRNMREMLLDENLHKDHDDKWRITFRGEQLKIATRNGRTNVFDLPFPPALVPLLEDYLKVWRPILLVRAVPGDKHVFLTRRGNPYTIVALINSTKPVVYRFTKKHWHPHIIRTVWATEMIRKGVNFLDVAEMLNDRLDTVIANYAHLRNENVAEKAFAIIDQLNGQGK